MTLLTLSLLVSLAALLAAAFAVWHMRMRVRRLIDALLAGIQALQSGSLAHRIEAGAGTELARLACGFNAMAGELQQHRRAAEAARAELEEAVNARTAELRSAHDTLQLAERHQRQFLEDISHELRTPATAIRGEAEIVLHGPEKPVHEYRLALQRIVASVQQMGVLIDDVLLLARVEADPHMVHRVATPWVDALSEAANLAEALGHGQHIEIRFDAAGEGGVAADDPLLAHADPDRLRQALFVVLDNAVRYSRPHGAVTVSWGAREDALCAIVRDQGIGIDAAELPKLFVRHARGARARAHRADGSGLGLAIAQSIVHAHDGQITIESRPGAGTTVRINIPRWRARTPEAA
jgi:signal transduction histidine kinase